MPVTITEIKFQDTYTGTESGGADQGADFLMGCVGDYMYAIIDFYVDWSLLNLNFDFDADDQTITIKSCGLVTGNWIDAGFQVGDSIEVSGSGTNDGSYTITELTDTVATVAETLIDESASGVSIYGTSTINSIDYYYNLTDRRQPLPQAWGPNNPLRSLQNNFNSLTDPNSLQKYTGVANTYYEGYSFMKPNSPSLAWYTHTIDGTSARPQLMFLGTTADYKQQYRITFPFLITPPFLSEQLSLIKNAYTQSQVSGANTAPFQQPDYFNGQNSLQFIFQIDAKYTTNKAKVDHTSSITTSFNPSNLSWFNSFFPSGVYDVAGNLLTQCQYKFSSIAYTIGGDDVDEIDFNQETDVEITMSKPVGSSATFDLSKFVVNFCYAPMDTHEYQAYSAANQLTFRQVFIHDRAVNQAASPSVNGDMFGTAYQIITDCSGVVSGGNLVISFKINMGATAKSVFENAAESNRNYIIWVTPQNNNVVEMVASNRSAILCDVNEATTDTDDSTLLQIVTNAQPDTYFYRCDDCDAESELSAHSPETAFNGYIGDYGINFTQFKVKSGCTINKINVSFEAQVRNAATTVLLGSFPLEEWNNDTTVFWDGNINQIQIDQPRNLPLPTEDLRNTRRIIRNSNIDGGGFYGYNMIYGFQLGYQYWQNLTNFYKVFNRYHTNYWAVYSQGYVGDTTDPNFTRIVPVTQTTEIVLKLVFEILENTTGVVTTFEHYADIFCYDENGNDGTWTITQDTFDKYGNSLSGVIQEEAPTTIVVDITGGSLATPGGYTALGELVAFYTSGGKEIFDRVSTLDAGVRQGSIWNELPNLLIDTTNNVASISADLDVNNLETTVNNIRVYGKLTFVK